MATGKGTWHTPLAIMKNLEEVNKGFEKVIYPLPEVPEKEITFFNNAPGEKRLQGYDQFFAYTRVKPLYNPRKVTDNSFYRPCMWEKIFQQDKDHEIPITTAHWYGRPCRVQYDFPTKVYNRQGQMNSLYRRNGGLVSDERDVHIFD